MISVRFVVGGILIDAMAVASSPVRQSPIARLPVLPTIENCNNWALLRQIH